MMLRVASSMLTVSWLFATAATALALDIGDTAPNFTASSVDGTEISLASANKDSALVVVCFTCNECPIAVAYEDRFIEFNKQFEGKDVAFIALNCNNQSEGLEAMKERAEEKGFNFDYAFDATGDAAKAYGAHVTPELFVVRNGKVAYHGAFDNDLNDPEKHYLADAVSELLDGKSPSVPETKPFGCGIRVKP